MAKKDEVQLDLFPVTPEITGLGITKFEVKGAEVVGTVSGVTNVQDVALLTDECWKKAVAGWLIILCKGDEYKAKEQLNLAVHRIMMEIEESGIGISVEH